MTKIGPAGLEHTAKTTGKTSNRGRRAALGAARSRESGHGDGPDAELIAAAWAAVELLQDVGGRDEAETDRIREARDGLVAALEVFE